MNLFSNCFVFVSFAADLSTDGKWCYLVFWVVGKPTTRWSLLKNRLLEVCPSYFSTSRIYSYRLENQQHPKPPDVFLLKFWCFQDRKGLLHGTPFFLPLISLLVFLRKCFQVYLSLLPLLDFSYFCIHVIEVAFMEQIYLSVILIFCFFTPCRCNWGSLWAWAYNKESKSIHYPGWESNGPLFYHRYQVWYSWNFFL